jgi:transcriptional antiterminator RfaH
MPDGPYWAVAALKTNFERLGLESAVARGYEIFVPRTRVKVGSRWVTQNLFGQYFFARISSQWRALERCPGIIGLIKTGEIPCKCPDEDIRRLLERSDRDGIIRSVRHSAPTRRALVAGEKVKVVDGAFSGLDAIAVGTSVRDRERVLLEFMSSRRTVEIPARFLAPAPA